MKITQRRCFLFLITLFILNFSLFSTLILNANSNSLYSNNNKIKIQSEEIEIKISSDKEPLDDGSYVVGSKLKFVVMDDNYKRVNIELTGEKEGRFFNISLKEGGDEFSKEWDTKNPNPGTDDKPVDPDTYKLALIIDGDEKKANIDEIVISKEQTGLPIWIIIIIIIGIIGGVSISALLVIKRKKAAKEVEFEKVDKKKSKKRGKIYSGASQIGKRSGEIAEAKTKPKQGPKSTETKASTTKVKKKTTIAPSIERASRIEKSSDTKKQLMPPASGFEFETRVAAGVAMIKDMELKMNIDQKVDFMISKIDSILQNIEFFKAILSQHEQEEFKCPICNKKTAEFWIKCPYCEIREHDSELGLKQSLLGIGGEVRFCPNCKRIIKANWIECPFCYILKK
ncbi:MAG: hypothetical protein ACTSQJ_08090 [Promethearchaeota archaeon]